MFIFFKDHFTSTSTSVFTFPKEVTLRVESLTSSSEPLSIFPVKGEMSSYILE